ncbi:MAG: alkaline phosphatase family protein [Acidobacteria bacterium]|nr:alkaline phosphatase family protein [Acidobacteriota bacterium]
MLRAASAGAILFTALGLAVASWIASVNVLGTSDRFVLGALAALVSIVIGAGVAMGAHVLGKIVALLLKQTSANQGKPGQAVADVLALLSALMIAALGARVGVMVTHEPSLVRIGCGLAALGSFLVGRAFFGRYRRALAAATRPAIVAASFALVTLIHGGSAFYQGRKIGRELKEGQAQFVDALKGQSVSDRKTLFIGVDGLSWEIAQAMVARDELPTLSRLMVEGAAGPLHSISPMQSPLIWNSMVTGVEPSKHGVTRFVAYRLAGVSQPLIHDISLRPAARGAGSGPRPRAKRGTPNSLLNRLLDAIRGTGLLRLEPISSQNCRRPRLWDIVEGAGGQAASIAWWASWPPDQSDALVISDAFYYDAYQNPQNPKDDSIASNSRFHTVHPSSRFEEFDRLRVSASDISDYEIRQFMDVSDAEIARMRSLQEQHGRTAGFLAASYAIETEFLFMMAQDKTVFNLTRHLLSNDPDLDFIAAYLRGVDIVSHGALEYGTPLDVEPRAGKYADVVRRYYQFTDELLAQLIAEAGPEVNVIIASDHGFAVTPDGYAMHAPEGVIFALGEAIKAGSEVRDADIYDVFSTLMALSGLAIPEDARGEVRRDIVKDEILADYSNRKVASYGLARGSSTEHQLDSREAVERLRALGYIE